jgi:transposase
MRELYVGMDLHSGNTYVGILEKGSFKRVFEKRVRNSLEEILWALSPYREEIKGITVESTFNWYWLVDGLNESGYDCVHLANPAAIQQYKGLKYADDRHDAYWLAQMLSLGILPEGYIYPKNERPVRDLLRKRSFLVKQRTAHIISLQSMIERHTGVHMSANAMRTAKSEDIKELLKEEHLVLLGITSFEVIEFLRKSIKDIEKKVKKMVKTKESFEYLHTVPGIGDILAMTIVLETGDISRFAKVGNFSSYCRCAPTGRISNGKKKGKGNVKNGNRYLAWAFIEAAFLSIGKSPKIAGYYKRKVSKTHMMVAIKSIASKLARACYYILRDGVPFKEEMLFC